MNSEELFLHGLSTYTPPCLRLTNSNMERIIHLLPTLADRYEACLIHRVWTTAAMNVLWECPHFSNVNAVRAFINTIHTYKRLALVVRQLNLCLDVGPAWPRNNSNNVSDNNDDDDDDKEFGATTSRYVLYQHEVYKESPLTSPHVIMTVLQQCERIDTLSIYGWKLEATHLRLIAAYLPRLQSLRIIGSSNKAMDSSNNKGIILSPLVASSLSKLHLYADYVVVPSRYMELESLRVSLSHSDSLEKLVYGHQHPLQKVHELMLGNVGVLKVDHMKAIFHMFPNVTRLAMEDVKQPIPYISIVQLEPLRHLIIRSMIDEVNDNDDKHTDNNNDSHPIHVGNNYSAHYECDTDDDISYHQSHLISICIENCCIQNNHFQRFVFNVDRLTRIILHKCPLLTDDALTPLCTIETILLEELKIVECIYIGNPTVRALTESSIIFTLRTFEMRSNGYLCFKDVFDFITTASSHQLSRVVIAGYPNISKFFLGQDSTGADVVLNQSKIRSMVQHVSVPKDRTLTSTQIIKLAKALDMDVHYLEELMEHIQLEDNENDECNNTVNLPLDANADTYNIYNHGNNNQSNNNHSSEVNKANAKLSLPSFQNYHSQQSDEKNDMNDYNQLTHERIEPDIIQKNNVYEENDDDGGSEDDESSEDDSNKNSCSGSFYNVTQEKEQQLQHVERQEEQEREQQLLLLQNQSQNQYQYQYQYQHNQPHQQKQLQQEYRKQETELPQYHEQQNHQLQHYQEDIIKKDEVEEDQEKKKNVENRNRANDIRSTLYNGNNLPNSSGSYSPDIRQQNECYSTSSSSSSGDRSGTNDISDNGSRRIPDLGGWGMTSDLSWLQNNNDNQCSGESTSNSLHRSIGGHSYEHAWKQIAHESPIVTAKQTNDNRIAPTADAGDGWGTPKANISWNDERLSYVHDVVEEHKNMTFWNQDENGDWEELSNSNINSSDAPSYPSPLKIRSNHTTTSPLRPSVPRRRKLYRSENLRFRPPSAFIPTSRPFRFEARNVKVSSQTLPVLSTSAQRQRNDGGANKWAAFSASQMQQSEAKKQKPATVQEEVRELEIPDLINLDLTDNDDINQLVPTYKPTTSTTSSDVEHGDIKSNSVLLDLQ